MNSTFDKIIDILMFRSGLEETEDGDYIPIHTTGSIVWGMILRSAIIFLIAFAMLDYGKREYIWIALFLLWIGAMYPGWRQFQVFQEKSKEVVEETLCGSCKHFAQSSQLCKIYDEHITKDYIPCEGQSWEPHSYEV